MRTIATVLAVMLAAGLVARVCLAAEGEDGPPDRPRRPDNIRRRGPGAEGGGGGRQDGEGRRPMRRMPHPVLVLFDADKDGVISADEIAKASGALKKLDRNEDGKVDLTELRMLRPPRPDGEQAGPAGGRRPPRPDGEGDGPPDGPRRPRRPGGEGGDQAGPPRRGPDPAMLVKRLMSFDKNGDDKLAKDELPERMQRIFGRADTDQSGALEEAEVKALAERFARGRPAGPGGPGGGPGGGPEGRRPPRDGGGPRPPRDGDQAGPPRRRRPVEEQ